MNFFCFYIFSSSSFLHTSGRDVDIDNTFELSFFRRNEKDRKNKNLTENKNKEQKKHKPNQKRCKCKRCNSSLSNERQNKQICDSVTKTKTNQKVERNTQETNKIGKVDGAHTQTTLMNTLQSKCKQDTTGNQRRLLSRAWQASNEFIEEAWLEHQEHQWG